MSREPSKKDTGFPERNQLAAITMPAYTTRPTGQEAAPQLGAPAPLLVVHQVINELQEMLRKEYPRVLELNSCSHEFMEILDRLEEEATRKLGEAGFKKIELPSSRERTDLPIGFYLFQGQVLVEIGVKGLNKCGKIGDLTRGGTPRIYARVYIGGQAAYVLEAEEKEKKRIEAGYFI